MRRFLAVAAAVTMIVTAIVIRSAIDSGGGSAKSATNGRPTIACVAELEAQCRTLPNVDVRVEDALVTAKTLADGTANIAAWVTFEPWPTMVNLLARRDIAGRGSHLGRSDLVIAMVRDRAERLAPTCGGTVDWKCFGEAIGKSWTELGGEATWGTVKGGVPPLTTARGVLLLGEAASGYFGRTDFATNDFDDAFLVWKANITQSGATFTRFIQEFPAAFSAVGAIRADTSSAGSKPVDVLSPAPAAMAVAVIVPINGASLPNVADELRRGLQGAGWSTDALDGPTGLPDAGVLLALSGLTG